MAKFAKGESGNPGGRPKGLGALVRETVEREGPGGRDGWVEVVKAQYRIATGNDERAKAKDMTLAATWLRDSGYGRPQQAVDVTSNGQTVSTATVTIPLATEALTDEQLEALRKELERAGAQGPVATLPSDESDGGDEPGIGEAAGGADLYD